MDRFCYQEGDISICKSLCDLCKNYDADNKKCTKRDVIPASIANNDVVCKFYADQYAIEL